MERGLARNLTLLEFFPILLMVVIWGVGGGGIFQDKEVCFHCDNIGVVADINQLTASSVMVVKLPQHLVLECLSFNAWVMAWHMLGVSNDTADTLSCSQWDCFRRLVPEAHKDKI